MENIFVEFLPPWIETGLQPAFYDKESGTALQQTARMYARVNMLIRMFNKLSKNTKQEIEDFESSTNETINEYIDKFNELHDYVQDYFDNLDVQEEINNKLDAMVEDGTLEAIIAHYLPLGYTLSYDTITEMKGASNYDDGSSCICLGSASTTDGGTSLFKIRAKTESDVIDEHHIYALTNSDTLIAERIFPEIEREDDSRVDVKTDYSYDLGVYYTKMTIPKDKFSFNLVYYYDSYQDGVYKYVKNNPGSVYSNGPLKSPTIIDGEIKIDAVPGDSEYWYILGTDTNGDIKYSKDVYREKTGTQLKALGYENCFGIWCPIVINSVPFDASGELNHSDSNYNYIINSKNPMCIFGYDDNNYYVVTVEGRNPRSNGIKFSEAITLVTELNIPNAFDMDGGGSCELWTSNPTTNIVFGDKNVATVGYSSHRAWELIKFTKES